MFPLFLCTCALLLCTAHAQSPDCLTSQLGTDYTGNQSTTASGKTCKAWISQSPHEHTVYKDADFPDGSAAAASNYCRNPNSDCKGPWCYTTDPATPIESCRIEICGTEGGTMNKIAVGIVGVVAGGLAIAAAPVVLGTVGFTAAGITAGSYAAGMMSAAAVANGGAVAAGSTVAVLQSFGVVGLSTAAAGAVGTAGAAVGAGATAFIQYMTGNTRNTTTSSDNVTTTAP